MPGRGIYADWAALSLTYDLARGFANCVIQLNGDKFEYPARTNNCDPKKQAK